MSKRTYVKKATIDRFKLEREFTLDGDLMRIYFDLADGKPVLVDEISDEDYAVFGPDGLNVVVKGVTHLGLTSVGTNFLVGVPVKVKTLRYRYCPKMVPLETGNWVSE